MAKASNNGLCFIYFKAGVIWGANQFCHYTNEASRAQRVICQITQLVSRRFGVRTQGSLQLVLDFFKMTLFNFYFCLYIYRLINC